MESALAKVDEVIALIQTHFARERWARDKVSTFQREAMRLRTIRDERLVRVRAAELERTADEAIRSLMGLLTPAPEGGVIDLRGEGAGGGGEAGGGPAASSLPFGLTGRDLVVVGGLAAAVGGALWLALSGKGSKSPEGAGSQDGVRMTKVAMFGGQSAMGHNPFLPEHNPFMSRADRSASRLAREDRGDLDGDPSAPDDGDDGAT